VTEVATGKGVKRGNWEGGPRWVWDGKRRSWNLPEPLAVSIGPRPAVPSGLLPPGLRRSAEPQFRHKAPASGRLPFDPGVTGKFAAGTSHRQWIAARSLPCTWLRGATSTSNDFPRTAICSAEYCNQSRRSEPC